ncbi:hypothetical protein OSB04_027960 [Centaurea solstitialis]|uniref:Uncharacterized protein n=1 Tax=Centaurea solstitialis TaxID=347529 RepID=A0AA38SEL4_9ASTR|nr:hypothetical protein OSB04_027960 [Centaurea solstitialis]
MELALREPLSSYPLRPEHKLLFIGYGGIHHKWYRIQQFIRRWFEMVYVTGIGESIQAVEVAANLVTEEQVAALLYQLWTVQMRNAKKMRSREVISTTHPVNKGGFDRPRTFILVLIIELLISSIQCEIQDPTPVGSQPSLTSCSQQKNNQSKPEVLKALDWEWALLVIDMLSNIFLATSIGFNDGGNTNNFGHILGHDEQADTSGEKDRYEGGSGEIGNGDCDVGGVNCSSSCDRPRI